MASSRPDEEPPGRPPEWAGWDSFVVPDDISELDAEIESLRRDRRGPGWRRRLLRVLETRRWQRYGMSGPLVVVVLLVVLFFASLVFALLPATPTVARSRPLAHPSAVPGTVGALLPDLALPVAADNAVRLRNLRPAVLIFVPARCDCAALIADVINTTGPTRLKVLLIGEGSDPRVPSTAPPGRVHGATDTEGRLAALYHLSAGPTVVFVRSDGVVTRVMGDAASGGDLRDELNALAR